MIIGVVVVGSAVTVIVGYGVVRLVRLSIDLAGAFDSSNENDNEDDEDEC